MQIKEIDILEFRKDVYKHYKTLFPLSERKRIYTYKEII